MGYEPIKVIAWAETDLNGHVNRVTEFDETSQSNKLSYRDGFPHITCVPNGENTRGPRLVDFNGFFYLLSNNLFELQQGNYPTYNAAVVGTGKPLPDGYPLGAVLWYPTGGYFVRSLVPNNTESDLSDINSWEKITISAADLASGLSGKVDLASGVAQADVDYVIENYSSGASWYRVYKNKFCIQGGIADSNAVYRTVSLLKQYKDVSYDVLLCQNTSAEITASDNRAIRADSKNTSGFRIVDYNVVVGPCAWVTFGYIN